MINNVQLIGRLTRDIDLRKTPQGDSVGRFTLAVDRNYKNKQGEYDADFINCQIWRQAADTLARYAHKGTKIAVDGNIRTGSYENQQGQKVYTTEVVVNNFYFVESRQQQQEQTPVQQDSPFSNFGTQVDISEDDLPF
ncbi:single-stranded DNA-binding protein [Globicatella sp. PHS-GS-PNBC-21-1553]|uniref:single-stranded DNA-binding protein n=1 Tax=Globicatella sp. PHS-GS-PNBC-21-1553 TaxID=2885764 RepID=UPI00298F1846|nr:single-stranded DNA-binding protein [Globicatella sp. PHS-GS-PNBC-21-1553]WPC09775.1 single-stranded DNA-binding protein [Globicatella sp. PHS-GS-PNBC-21-1553]